MTGRISQFPVACTLIDRSPRGTMILRPWCRDESEIPDFAGSGAALLPDGKIKGRTVRAKETVVFQWVIGRFCEVRESGAPCDLYDFCVISTA